MTLPLDIQTPGMADAPAVMPGTTPGPAARGTVASAPVVATREPAGPGPHVLGLDLSLTRTGVAAASGADTLKPPGGLKGFARMRWIRSAVLEWVASADLVVVEAPAFSMNKSYAKENAGLWHVVMCAIDARGTRWIDVQSTSLKKYATGNGGADKSQMVIAAVKRLSIDVSNDDEADAAWACALGRDLLGVPLVHLPKNHRVALDAVRARLTTGESD